MLNGVFKSDTVIPEDLRRSLQSAAYPLEKVPDHQKDWHPGSGEQVLDLVHPSLYPLLYGQTRVLSDGVVSLDDCIKRYFEGEIAVASPKQVVVEHPFIPFEERQVNNAWSYKFQWLPSEFVTPFDVDDVK